MLYPIVHIPSLSKISKINKMCYYMPPTTEGRINIDTASTLIRRSFRHATSFCTSPQHLSLYKQHHLRTMQLGQNVLARASTFLTTYILLYPRSWLQGYPYISPEVYRPRSERYQDYGGGPETSSRCDGGDVLVLWAVITVAVQVHKTPEKNAIKKRSPAWKLTDLAVPPPDRAYFCEYRWLKTNIFIL